jgi:cyclophilin family peptidyl-prolyl cis-trans isomerase
MEQGQEGFAKNVGPTPFNWEAGNVKRPKVFFDMMLEDEKMGRLEFELAQDIVPKTVENFLALVTGSGKYTYKGTKIHDIIKDNTIRAGDVEKNDGTMSHSSLSKRYFNDENFIIPNTSRGLLSMVSTGVHSNGSQFYITLAPAKHLNGRCVGFGRLVNGEDVIQAIEKVHILIFLSIVYANHICLLCNRCTLSEEPPLVTSSLAIAGSCHNLTNNCLCQM